MTPAGGQPAGVESSIRLRLLSKAEPYAAKHKNGSYPKLYHMQVNDRLKRLIADETDCCGFEEIDQCRNADVEERLNALHALKSDAENSVQDEDLRSLSRLGNETRYTIVRLLVAADDDLCVCELEPLLNVGESAISHALSDLSSAGLVKRQKQGKWHFYQPTDRARALVDAIDATQG